MTDTLTRPGEIPETRFQVRVRRPLADRIYRGVARAAGGVTLVLMALIGTFLFVRALPALREEGFFHFLTETRWQPQAGRFGIRALMLLTIEIAVIALAIAVPLALGVSLYITEYAPRRIKNILTLLVDLLAAVPSLIYGLWGLFYLQPRLRHVSLWLSRHLAFIPIFRVDASNSSVVGSTFIAGVVVSLMVIPICAAVMREVFSQAPPGEKEGALALGGTRWGMVRTVILPFGRGGIIGGSMLGLGRALGETIAVVLLLPQLPKVTAHILQNGGATVSGFIANSVGATRGIQISGLLAAGLVLFVMTLITNMIASVIISRSRSGAGVEM
jgi:phosphate transport system permease protein